MEKIKNKRDNFIKKIQKRNGQIVFFDKKKIIKAINKAGEASGEFGNKIAIELTNKVIKEAKKLIKNSIPKVEEIQDIVESVLLHSKYKITAKKYILYRDQHKQIREISDTINNNLIESYLNKTDWQVKENSNMAYSLQGLNNYISSEVSKNYWLNKIYPEEIKNTHINGDFHIHDLNILSVYCVGWDLHDLLIQGFTGVEGKVSTKPASHLKSALGQAVNFFYTLQGEAAGAQAFSNFDTLLAPFIRYDKLTKKEIKQIFQGFVFNMNVATRVGFQTPFTNVTLDLTIPKQYAKQGVIIGGKIQKEKYEDFQKEVDVFNEVFLEVMAEGDAMGRVFTFPIPTYNITKDFDWDKESNKTLWKIAGKYGIPYFSNFINSDMDVEDARSMCCRLRIDNRLLEKRGGGLFGANPLTGSIGVVTINLPRIGYETKNKTDFLKRLKELMLLAKESLEIKRKVLEKFTDENLYPYTKYYLRDIKKGSEHYWTNHFSTIGIVGMNEAIFNLYNESVATEKGKKFAEDVLDFMRDLLINFQKETGNNYNLEATPAEGTSYRFALLDQKKFDDCCFANGKGKAVEFPFYTNSTHQPVNFTEDLFETLDSQDSLQTKYTGGTVLHLFVGEKIEDGESLKNLVKKICENYHLPYFTFSPTFSICPNHGYVSGEKYVCSECDGKCEVYSRVVGYLRPISQWNDGKVAEFAMRKVYKIENENCDKKIKNK